MLGPVFQAELLTTARRARYYLARVIYGIALLAVLWSGYQTVYQYVSMRGSEEMTIREMSSFANSTYGSFTTLQGVAIVLLTPALVAPVIASEKSRKTMHYLLSSRLTSAEIVLGKLAARLLMLLVILAVGLPVFSLLQLFGGIEGERIIETYLVLSALLISLSGLSILISTLTPEPRRAIFYAYAAPVSIVLFPLLVKLLLFRFGEFADTATSALAWIWPLPRYMYVTFQDASTPDDFRNEMVRTGVVATLYGLGFMGLATLLVRPIGRREEKQKRVELRIDKRGRWHWRVLPRPEVGEDAMLWKERFTSQWSGVIKLVVVFIHLFVATLVGCFLFELLRESWGEMIRQGYGSADWGGVRAQFNQFLRSVTLLVVGLWMLGTAATAAGAITTEREADTWISLLSTPLTGGQILRAKIVGAILRFKWLGVLLAVVWAAGLLVGAIHLIGFVLVMLELPIFIAFAAALGVACSLDSKTTTRSLALTLGLLVALNGGYLIVTYSSMQDEREPYMGGVAPWVIAGSLASYPDVLKYDEKQQVYSYGYVYDSFRGSNWAPRSQLIRAVPAIATAIPLYLLGAALLIAQAVHRFDRICDRPKTIETDVEALPASERRKRFAM
jgi:ABC-type transport system involved in multi-copper enzyme maturation permease subunit